MKENWKGRAVQSNQKTGLSFFFISEILNIAWNQLYLERHDLRLSCCGMCAVHEWLIHTIGRTISRAAGAQSRQVWRQAVKATEKTAVWQLF